MVWQTGQSLYGGRYRVARLLGQGGFGIAYLAHDQKGKPVVIKTLKDDVLLDKKNSYFCDRFKDEALKLAVCRHPHIVAVQNVFTEPYTVQVKGRPTQVEAFCLVMEFIDGENLAEMVKRRGALPELEAVTYIRQIGEALAFVHELGLLHRDIKPSNILIRRDRPEAVLIDFGLARSFLPDTELDFTVALTHGYAPPEQYSRRVAATVAVDIYALAGTLYYLLTKQIPAPAMDRMMSMPLLPVQKFNPQVSEVVSQAIYKGMELKPEQRPATMLAWLALLPPVNPDQVPLPPPPPPTANFAPPSPVRHSVAQPVSIKKTKMVALTSNLQTPVQERLPRLEHFLTYQKWKEADLETALIIHTLAKRREEGWLSVDSIRSIPSSALMAIDRLWHKYSMGRFGFRLQKRIWESVGGSVGTSDYEVAKRFGLQVGWVQQEQWLEYDQLSFAISAPVAHLPSWRCGGQKAASWVAGRMGFLLARWR
ncbi:MAG: serine/threonine-protein kinase [Pseudanabaenaceae cyanobacterium]